MNYVYGNWKMNLLPEQALQLASEVNSACSNLNKTTVGIAPTTLALRDVINAGNSNLEIGAQNAHWEETGAYTGDVSAKMYKEAGCDFIIIGHSERRHKFHETQEDVSQRAQGVVGANLKLIYCIGELLEEREQGTTFSVVEEQTRALFNLDSTKIIIAYEPVWAIGTGKVASLEDINTVHNHLVSFWNDNCDANCPPILYGGSVNPDNFAEIIAIEHVAGALVGGASLKADSFCELVKIAEA